MSELGILKKDTKYRDRLLEKIDSLPENEKSRHPFFKGIKMQAHHLISADGVSDLEDEDLLISAGYNINKINNIVLIPCTFSGACHLGTQLHRGNHTSTVDMDESLDETYDDDDHPDSYHETVEKMVVKALRKPSVECVDQEREVKDLIKEMDEISGDMVSLINNFSPRAQLTKVFQAFNNDGLQSKIGCSGAVSMKNHKMSLTCPSHRDHEGEVITIKKSHEAYKLRAGN